MFVVNFVVVIDLNKTCVVVFNTTYGIMLFHCFRFCKGTIFVRKQIIICKFFHKFLILYYLFSR